MVKIEKVPVQAPEVRAAGPNPLLKGIYPSRQKQFLSTVQTGTGASQNVAHGLGATPAGVLVVPVDTTASTNAWAVAEGTHTSTNVVLTVTASATFKVLAWL